MPKQKYCEVYRGGQKPMVGDLVSRRKDDRHVVEKVNEYADLIRVRCIRADAVFDIGDVEDNLTRRYDLVSRNKQCSSRDS